jgi:uncharacterized membrane protein
VKVAVVLTLVAVLAQTLGNLCLSLAARSRVRWFVPALTLLAVHFFTWCQALKMAPLSKLVPLTASSHLLNALLAKYLLGEQISAQRWLGTGCIVSGILVILL